MANVTSRTGLFVKKQSGGMFSVEDMLLGTGSRFYVHSGTGSDTVGYGYNPDSPTATIDYAHNLCTANKNDMVIVMPGHAETLTGAAGISCDTAGVTFVGLGNGTNRPTITFGTSANADINVSAANVKWTGSPGGGGGFKMVSNVNNLANFFDLDEGNCTIEDCLFVTSSAKEAVNFINIATTKDDFVFRRLDFRQPTDPEGTDAGANTGGIYCVDSENIFLEDIYFNGQFETAFFHNDTTKCQNVWMRNIYGYNNLSTSLFIVLEADSTGGITDSLVISPNADDISLAKIVGTIGNKFFLGRTANFGNDNGGGSLAAFGDAEAS